MTTVLGISGSLRAASTNTLLMREAMRVSGAGTLIEADLRLPLYDGDLEADGLPAVVQTLADQIAAADAVVIATPEYNKALSGVLKNALDWVSRTDGKPWADKPVAIMSAAAGRAGGERALSSLMLCMAPFGARVLMGGEVLVAASYSAFDEDGRLIDERYAKALDGLVGQLGL